MELNGKDYTIQAVILLTILVLFFLQYVLCKKTKNPWIRAIPFLAPLAALIGAAACVTRSVAAGATVVGVPARPLA